LDQYTLKLAALKLNATMGQLGQLLQSVGNLQSQASPSGVAQIEAQQAAQDAAKAQQDAQNGCNNAVGGVLGPGANGLH
jgi:hypothetical protein